MANLAHRHFILVHPGEARRDLRPLRDRAGRGHGRVDDRPGRILQGPPAANFAAPAYAGTFNASNKIG
jgi:hypothetical protein